MTHDTDVAVIGDIHGNIWALDAVLEDINRRGVSSIVNVGDSLYGPLAPGETADRLIEHNILSVRGNTDRILLFPDAPDAANAFSLEYARAQLNGHHLRWLGSLAEHLVIDETFFACHGTPRSDSTYLLEAVDSGEPVLRAARDLVQETEGVPQPIVLCGHSHLSHTVTLPSGQLIVNPGSVGVPAYADDLPVPHRMEAGSPFASYAILSPNASQWVVNHVLVPYDTTAAIQAAQRNNRPDWAVALRTGRAS